MSVHSSRGNFTTHLLAVITRRFVAHLARSLRRGLMPAVHGWLIFSLGLLAPVGMEALIIHPPPSQQKLTPAPTEIITTTDTPTASPVATTEPVITALPTEPSPSPDPDTNANAQIYLPIVLFSDTAPNIDPTETPPDSPASINSASLSGRIYFNDFEGAIGPEWSTTATASTVSNSGATRLTTFLGRFSNTTATLAFTNLASHKYILVSFDLFVIQSWDGDDTYPGVGPDKWKLSVSSGPTLLDATFSNVSYVTQNYPNPGSAYGTGATEVNTLGYDKWYTGLAVCRRETLAPS